jgi:hypothetical protein
VTDRKTVQFMDKTYSNTVEGIPPENSIELGTMSEADLLSLRNLVAANLGVGEVKGFKTHEAAVSGAWKALCKLADTIDEENAEAGVAEKAPKEKKVRAPKAPKEKKVRAPKAPKEKKDPTAAKLERYKVAPPKCIDAQIPKRPSKFMFARYFKVRDPEPGRARSFVWDQYHDGERIIDVMVDPTRHADKVRWWAAQVPPYMRLEEISDEQYATEVAEFCEKHGLPNPLNSGNARKEELEKLRAEKAAEKAAAAEAKAAEKAAAKAAKEAEKAAAAEAKAAEKAAAKAAKEAEKAAAAEAKAAAAIAAAAEQPDQVAAE